MIELLFTLNMQGAGSDAYHRPSDPPGIYYSISDRGPNIDHEDGKVFLKPEFNPSIYKWSLQKGQEPVLLEEIPLKGPNGESVNGLANEAYLPEVAYGPEFQTLAFDANGVDTEGLVVLEDGSFFISEEYGPSILKIDAGGHIQERWIPKGSEKFYTDLPYAVRPILPEIYGQRRANRGFESLALTPDGKHLLVANQSALAWPDEKTAKNSGLVRIMKLSLDGKVESVSAYQMDDASTFEEGAKTGDLKVSAMLYHQGKLLIEERTDKSVKIFRIEKLGRDIKNSKWMARATSPSLEGATELPKLAKKELLWDSIKAGVTLPSKIESVISWDENQLLLLNDDDFGVTGEKSQGWVLTLP